MQCPMCGADVRANQKFCMECGTSLRGVVDETSQIAALAGNGQTFPPPADERHRGRDDLTLRVSTTAPTMATTPLTTGHEAVTSELPPTRTAAAPFNHDTDEWPTRPTEGEPTRPRRSFRLRPLLVLAVLGLAAAITGTLTSMIGIEAAEPAPFEVGSFMVNDFGTNNTIAGLLAAGTMVLGALLWCFGFRWGAGLAGGGGAALAGWVALVLGVAEWPIFEAQRAALGATITRDVGYWALVGAGGVGVLVLLLSLARAGRDGRAGLDPWIAALGAVSFLVAAGGPLIPEGTADWSGNYSSATLAVDLPTLLFVGRAVQLGLLALCGVAGFLLVRRYGLGLAVGSAVAAGWLLATAATNQTPSPIGPGYANPGARDLQPHAMTIVGMALVGFFALVAVVMALLDSDR